MHSRLSDFMAARAAETYPEPRTSGHDGLTAQMAAIVAPMLPTGAKACDVGCGQGPALEWFKDHGIEAIGITTNADDLRACKEAGHQVIDLDMHEIGEIVGLLCQFDLVWARHVLEHSPIPLFVLFEFARVLKPGGIVYVETPAPDTSCRHETNPNHYSVLTLGMWQSLISRAGFEIMEVREISIKTDAGPDTYFSIIAKKK